MTDTSMTQTGAAVRDMLGIADRARVWDLLEAVLSARIAEGLGILGELYDRGADPVAILQDLLEAVHFATRARLAPEQFLPGQTGAAGLPEMERTQGVKLAEALGLAELARAWQILLKGHGETQMAPLPRQAAEMVLIRLGHASELPTPGELVRQLSGSGSQPAPAALPSGGGGGTVRAALSGGPISGSPISSSPARAVAQPLPETQAVSSEAPRLELASFRALVALIRQRKELQLANMLERDVGLVRFAAGDLALKALVPLANDFVPRLSRLLSEWTGRSWTVALVEEAAEPPLGHQVAAEAQARKAAALQHPLAQALLGAFPGAKLVAHRRPEAEETPPALPPGGGDATSPAAGEAQDYPTDYPADYPTDDLAVLLGEAGADLDD